MTGPVPRASAGVTQDADDWRGELRREYARALPHKLARLERRLAALAAAPADAAAFDALLGAVHRLHGSAGSYGFGDLGRLAGEWERHLLDLRGGGGPLAPDTLEPMWAWLTAIRREGPEPSTGPAAPVPTQDPPPDTSSR